ncbi:MAG: putative zinc-binding protein [Syntrophaceae bacterium]
MNQPMKKLAPPVMILACSGAANVGQMANRVAVELTREGFGQMFCVAALGAHLPKFVNYAQKVPSMVAIDGCSIGCIRSILEHVEVPLRSYVVLTELGFEKNMNSNLEQADIEKVKQAVRSGITGSTLFPTRNPSDGGCCGT